MTDSDSEELSLDTHFKPQDDDDDTLFEVVAIIGERGDRYRVQWAGTDPKTNKPWAPSWVPKQDVTDDLQRLWRKKKRRGRTGGQGKRKRKRGQDQGEVVVAQTREESLEIPILSEEPIPISPKSTHSQGADIIQNTGPLHSALSTTPLSPFSPDASPPRPHKRQHISPSPDNASLFEPSEDEAQPCQDIIEGGSLSDRLLASETRVAELNGLVEQLRSEGLAALRRTYDERIRRLESEVAQWRGLCGILQEKDENTNDDIRRRAGEEPELRMKLRELEQKHSQLEKERDKLAEERVLWLAEKEGWVDEAEELTLAKEQLESEKAEWEAREVELCSQIDNTASELAVLRAEKARFDADRRNIDSCVQLLNTYKKDLAKSMKVGLSGSRVSDGDSWFVCLHIEDGKECYRRFRARADLRSHVWQVHYQ